MYSVQGGTESIGRHILGKVFRHARMQAHPASPLGRFSSFSSFRKRGEGKQAKESTTLQRVSTFSRLETKGGCGGSEDIVLEASPYCHPPIFHAVHLCRLGDVRCSISPDRPENSSPQRQHGGTVGQRGMDSIWNDHRSQED